MALASQRDAGAILLEVAMRSRKEFLVTAGAAAAASLAPESSIAATPAPAPTATPTPSPAGREFALRMRRFDPSLTDAQIDAIAAGVDQSFEAGKTIRRHHELQNSDGPTPEFAAGE